MVKFWAYSSVVEYQFPKLQTGVRALVGPPPQTKKQPLANGCFLV